MSQNPLPTIRSMEPADWPAVRAIYVEGIKTGNATFGTDPGDWQTFDTDRLASPRLVAELDGQIAAWATLSGTSDRCVYAGVAEASIYVAEIKRGRGLGRTLLTSLIEQSEKAGLWTLQAGIFPENEGSLALFTAAGFRTIGHRERLGKSFDGRWRDVLFLERRSQTVGV